MGKLSGRHAFRQRLEDLGYKLTEEEVNHAFERFKRLADQKKEIYEEDLEVIVSEEVAKMSERVVLKSFQVESGTNRTRRPRLNWRSTGSWCRTVERATDRWMRSTGRLPPSRRRRVSY